MGCQIRDIAGKEGQILVICDEQGGRFPRCYSVVVLGDRVALIDAGCSRSTLAAIDREFAPEIVITSHAHPDHCSGAARFSDRLWGPIESRAWAGNLQRMADRFIGPGPRRDWLDYMTRTVGFEDFGTGRFFGDGHEFDLGSTRVQAVRAPGHTDDHYCFYFPDEQIMLTTDIDFTSFGPWYGNVESDIDRFARSIDHVRSYPLRAVISSHKGLIRDELDARFDAFVAAFAARDARILTFLQVPRQMADFVEEALVYRRYAYRASILRY